MLRSRFTLEILQSAFRSITQQQFLLTLLELHRHPCAREGAQVRHTRAPQ